jgi:hypothetical protein
MRIASKALVLLIAVLISVACATSAMATTITWLDMSPVPLNTTPPNNSVYNVPGIGNVTVTCSIPANFTIARQAGAGFTAGNIGATETDQLRVVLHDLHDGPDPLVPLTWSITYTFPTLLPGNSVYIGSIGLGKTTSFGGGASIYTVNQNGGFLGDYTDGGPWGPTMCISGGGTFSLQNSVSGSGGLNPWWNTPLGVVRIVDNVSSVTVQCSQIRGDGIAVNIGFDTELPTPTRATTWGRLKSLYR